MPQIASRMKSVPVSAVRKLSPLAQAAKNEGVHVYHLNIGDPDIETPEVMIDALRNWTANPIRYSPSQGNPELLASLSQYYAKLGYPGLNESNILATMGGSEGLLMLFFAIASAGDEILVFEPFYSNYAALAAQTQVTLRSVPTSLSQGFHLPAMTEIELAITPKTKAILYTSPGNPTGTVYTKQEVEQLVEIAKKHDIYLIADEVYREYVFDSKHTSLGSYMTSIPDHAILVDSLSKRYSLCGARIGVVSTLNTELWNGLMVLAQARLSGGYIDQTLAAKLTQVPQSYIDETIQEYKKRRDLVYSTLTSIPGVTLAVPEGAFYTMVELPVEDAEDFCRYLLTTFRSKNPATGVEETVMFAPGNGFYANPETGKKQVRLAYVLNTTDLNRALIILQEALVAYSSRDSVA